jgi:bifunctional UDP-N-acetylglucosamine pyrophosphorylase / glucosamine-1-phosphate N-acetyltransferase
MKRHLAVVILAAGEGKRLGGKSQKVVKKILNKPILLYLFDTIEKISPDRVIVIVGYKKEEVYKQLRGKKVGYAEQKIPMGTGDAVLQAKDVLKDYQGNILILCGDIPFITASTLRNLISTHKASKNCGTILTTISNNPEGYGRIKRNGLGNVLSIVEELNATEEERGIKEVNAGIYVFDKKKLFYALKRVLPDSIKKEYYLTDVVSILSSLGEKIGTYTTEDSVECMGINSLRDMEKARGFLLKRRMG